MIQSGRSFGTSLGNLRKKALSNIALPLARDNLPGLFSKLASNALNKFEKKISRKGAVITGKRFTLFVLNKGMNDIIKILKSLEYLARLVDGFNETVKQEKTSGFLRAFLAPLAVSLVQPAISSVVKGINGKDI